LIIVKGLIKRNKFNTERLLFFKNLDTEVLCYEDLKYWTWSVLFYSKVLGSIGKYFDGVY
jgi:hypothetical protein